MQKINDTTYLYVPKDDVLDRIEVIGGDDKQSEFVPQAKVQRWDNECNVSMRLMNYGEGSVVEEQGQIRHERTGENDLFYNITQTDQLPEGGFEFEVILESRPASNEIQFSLEYKDAVFFYQPELTQEEIDNGAYRPEHIIGSYAVYRKTEKRNVAGGKSYKTNKIGHIHRPQITDDAGNWTWGLLDIADDVLTITIPQTFLDNAVYPVSVDPTFGYTTAGGSSTHIAAVDPMGTGTEQLVGTGYELTEDSSGVDSISVHFNSSSDNTGNFKAAVYNEDSEGADSHGYVTHAQGTSVIGDWVTLSISPSLSQTFYILCAIGDQTSILDSESMDISYDVTGALNYYTDDGPDYSTLPDPWNKTENSTGRKYSIYVTYSVQTVISITDTGSGSDAVGQINASFSLSDAGSGAEALGQGADLTIAETGSGTETIISPSVLLSVQEAASAVDEIAQALASLKIEDAGAGTEAISVTIPISIQDAGSGIEAVSVPYIAMTIQESGIGVDSIRIQKTRIQFFMFPF